jgi:hypothetical protein
MTQNNDLNSDTQYVVPLFKNEWHYALWDDAECHNAEWHFA